MRLATNAIDPEGRPAHGIRLVGFAAWKTTGQGNILQVGPGANPHLYFALAASLQGDHPDERLKYGIIYIHFYHPQVAQRFGGRLTLEPATKTAISMYTQFLPTR